MLFESYKMPQASIRGKSMKGENKKFDYLSQLYERFTKENKEKLIKSATSLLKVQKEDAGMIADIPPMEAERQNNLRF
jgi:hypothetical protein